MSFQFSFSYVALYGVQGAEPLVGGSEGRSPHEAETLFAFERSMEAANSPIFFMKFAGKWHKTHLFI